jgi:hypothetical protein
MSVAGVHNTLIMERDMKPAAATSLAPFEVYIRSLAEELVKISPAARNPTIAT